MRKIFFFLLLALSLTGYSQQRYRTIIPLLDTATVEKTYVQWPAPPTFSDPNTLAVEGGDGNVSVFNSDLGGKTEQSMSPGMWTRLIANGINGIKFKSSDTDFKTIIGDRTETGQRCISTLGGSDNLRFYDLILNGNGGGLGFSGAGSAPGVNVLAHGIQCYDPGFAGVFMNTPDAFYNSIDLQFWNMENSGGEFIYVGNTTNSNRSPINYIKVANFYADSAGWDGLQLTSTYDGLVVNNTFKTTGLEDEGGQDQQIQLQDVGVVVRDNIFDLGAETAGSFFSHGFSLLNNYFRWAEPGGYYVGDADPAYAPITYNNQPQIIAGNVFDPDNTVTYLFVIYEDDCDIIIRNNIISTNVTNIYQDNRVDQSTYSIIVEDNTMTDPGDIDPVTYEDSTDPYFTPLDTYANTAAMFADQGSQSVGGRYVAGSQHYIYNGNTSGDITDYFAANPPQQVTSDFHYNRGMGAFTPPNPLYPTNISLTGEVNGVVEFEEGNSIDDVIGELSVTVPSGTATLEILDWGFRSGDNADFSLDGLDLVAESVFTFPDTVYVRLRATNDADTLKYLDKVFTIVIVEPPAPPLTVTARGTVSSTSGSTTYAFSPTSNPASDSDILFFITYDNSGTDGADPYSSISDSEGNTWTSIANGLADPGTASAGAAGRWFITSQDGGAVTTGTTITITFTNSVTNKTGAFWEIAGSMVFDTYVTESSVSGFPTITMSGNASGNLIFGGLGRERNDSQTGDSDTTDGTWSTAQNVGVGTIGMQVMTQYKVLTGTSDQTYNPTTDGASGDNVEFILRFVQE